MGPFLMCDGVVSSFIDPRPPANSAIASALSIELQTPASLRLFALFFPTHTPLANCQNTFDLP